MKQSKRTAITIFTIRIFWAMPFRTATTINAEVA